MQDSLILVADDNQEIRDFLSETVLPPAGYTVRTVGDGMSALTLAQELKPALVITDQNMPNLTGIELIRRLRRDHPDTPAILMTSEGSERLAVEALRAGASDYLTKPFEAEQLLAAVGRALSESRRWRSLERARAEAKVNTANLKSRLQEFEALAQIGRNVTSMLDLDEVLTVVVEAAVELTQSEEGSLLLLDSTSGELYMRASKNFDEEFARTFRLHVQDSLAGGVIASGEAVLIDQSTPQKIKTSYLVHSLIYVPLKVRQHTIGVLGVDNRKAGRVLSNQDAMVMTALADYAAIAIENAQLYTSSEVQRRKLETILEQTENGVIVVDPDNRLILVNRAAQDAFQIPDGLINQSIVESLDHPRLLALIRAPGNTPRRDEIEASDGRIFNAQRTPIEGVGQAILMHDITHLKELDRIKSEFVTTVSHDLRSPLTAILGYVELIDRAGDINDQQKEFIRRVHVSVEQITNLVTDLLDLGRIEAGLDTAKEPTPLGVMARYAIESLRGMAVEKELQLELQIPDTLPQVYGDPIRLRQMIGNLLSNAIKYTPAGGTVRLGLFAENDQVILRVQDTGAGIPPGDQPYLFDKFFRASNIPQDSPGTGLGLSIVKSIVDSHDGRIWVDSRLGEGTLFTVVLPALTT
ncbi:MAG: response regulator [Anaerolineales bacterium]|nr:response regulator [Anaerolineales bacterium]